MFRVDGAGFVNVWTTTYGTLVSNMGNFFVGAKSIYGLALFSKNKVHQVGKHCKVPIYFTYLRHGGAYLAYLLGSWTDTAFQYRIQKVAG